MYLGKARRPVFSNTLFYLKTSLPLFETATPPGRGSLYWSEPSRRAVLSLFVTYDPSPSEGPMVEDAPLVTGVFFYGFFPMVMEAWGFPSFIAPPPLFFGAGSV